MSTAITTPRPRSSWLSSSPIRTLREDVNQLINRLSSEWDGQLMNAEFSPACDLSETAEAYQVRLDVPGIKPDDITVQVTGDSVSICGERKEEKEEKGKTFHRLERRSGKFSEMLRLPEAVNEEKVLAEFHDGVLTVTLPKAEAAKARTVKVKSESSK